MTPLHLVNRLLETDEEDFDLVGAIQLLPDRPRRWVQKTEVLYDEEGNPFDENASSPVYFESSSTLTQEVTDHLNAEGACFASSPDFEPGLMYMDEMTDLRDDPDAANYEEAHSRRHIWRLGNFDPEEENAIFNSMYHAGQ